MCMPPRRDGERGLDRRGRERKWTIRKANVVLSLSPSILWQSDGHGSEDVGNQERRRRKRRACQIPSSHRVTLSVYRKVGQF